METTTHTPNVRPSFPFRVRFVCPFQRHLASCTVSKNRKVSLAERRLLSSVFFAVLSVRPTWMCSIAVLRDDLISSSLSMRSWCRCLRIIHLLARCLVLIHSQSASTALRRQFINGDKESSTTLHFCSDKLARFRDVYVESSNLSLFCDETDSISNSQNTLFRQLCFCCGVRTHAELVDVVHHALEIFTRTSCLRRLALCEIWPASLKVPRPFPSTTKSCSRKALWACIDVFVRFSQTDEVVCQK